MRVRHHAAGGNGPNSRYTFLNRNNYNHAEQGQHQDKKFRQEALAVYTWQDTPGTFILLDKRLTSVISPFCQAGRFVTINYFINSYLTKGLMQHE
jgi:hypothetical protein